MRTSFAYIEFNAAMLHLHGLPLDETAYYDEGAYVLRKVSSILPNSYRLVRGSGEVGDIRFSVFMREDELEATLAANGWEVRDSPA